MCATSVLTAPPVRRRPRSPLAGPQGRTSTRVSAGVLRGVAGGRYAGFNENGHSGGALIEAACWAHTRRKFFDVHAKTGSAVALEDLERIGSLYEVNRSISGKPPDERGRQRQARSRPLATALKAWAETILPQLSGASDLAKAFRYMLARWVALTRVFDDGCIALDNNPAERALQSVAVGRKNYLFAGSGRGADRAVVFYTLIETVKFNGLDPEAYLRRPDIPGP